MTKKHEYSGFFLHFLKLALDAVLPPRCAGTGKVVDRQGAVSAEFWDELQFIEKPFCQRCGLPFSFDSGDGLICAECMLYEPHFDLSRSAVVYNDASRKIILGFKFRDKTHFVHSFVPWMLRTGGELIEQADCIVPVPLHDSKLRQRLFNQSAVLAQEIALISEKSYMADGLLRIRATIPQKGLTRKERLLNIAGTFAVNEKFDFKGKSVLLIDDIFTTGATLNECAKTLKQAGAQKVNILTIARTLKEESF